MEGIDLLADDEDGSGARLLSAAGAGRDLTAHGTVQAGSGAELAGQGAQQGGGERVRDHSVCRAGLGALL